MATRHALRDGVEAAERLADLDDRMYRHRACGDARDEGILVEVVPHSAEADDTLELATAEPVRARPEALLERLDVGDVAEPLGQEGLRIFPCDLPLGSHRRPASSRGLKLTAE
jgi:hypothetical protein